MRTLGLAAVAVALIALASCDTVDLGDNFVAPEVQLDDDFFFCRVQPEVIAVHTCASGQPTDGGGCHAARAFPRLDPAGESDPRPACDETNRVIDPATIPVSYMSNLTAVSASVTSDPLTSPLYTRPTAIDTHPRQIFPPEDPAAQLIVQWIRGTP